MATCLVTLFFDSYFTVRWLPEKKRVFKKLFDGKNAKLLKMAQTIPKKMIRTRCSNIIKGKQKYYS